MQKMQEMQKFKKHPPVENLITPHGHAQTSKLTPGQYLSN
jgi:hypothetical protein